jgi:hypothetical protein
MSRMERDLVHGIGYIADCPQNGFELRKDYVLLNTGVMR